MGEKAKEQCQWEAVISEGSASREKRKKFITRLHDFITSS